MAEFEFAILGAGAMGSILGAHLARAGHSVAMLARGARAAQIEHQGLRIKGLSELTVPVRVLRKPSELFSTEVLIVATKTPGTAEALQGVRYADIGVALSIQNGPLKNELLTEAFGIKRVLGALADTSGELLPDGEVLFTRNVGIFVGEVWGGASPRAQDLAQSLDQAGLRAAMSTEILSLEWSKFCAWVGLMVVSVLTRLPTWQYACDRGSALVVVRLVREIASIAQALGITPSDDSVLPVATMVAGTESAAAYPVLRLGEEFKNSAPRHRMSSLQDLEAGRPLEVQETLGYAVRKAADLGLKLPLLESFYPLIATIDRLQRLDGPRAH